MGLKSALKGLTFNNTSNVRMNVTLRRVRVPIFALEYKYYMF